MEPVMTADLDAPHFHDEDAARRFLEEVRWPDGPICPHCGSVGNAYKTKKVGVYRCGARECRKDFTVRVGTLFERSHIALHTWLFATHLLTSSKKGMSSHQMHRMLGVTYKTAWFMTHRIREAMRELHPLESGPLGGEGKFVEVDETYVGGKEGNKHSNKRLRRGRGAVGKEPVVSLVERDGKVRSFHVADVSAKTLRPILKQQIDKASHLRTDESGIYWKAGEDFASHENRQSFNRGIRSRQRAHQHGRKLFLDPQARHCRHVPSRFRGASEAVRRRVRLPLQPPLRFGRDGSRARPSRPQGH
jgi:transposase-like protein